MMNEKISGDNTQRFEWFREFEPLFELLIRLGRIVKIRLVLNLRIYTKRIQEFTGVTISMN